MVEAEPHTNNRARYVLLASTNVLPDRVVQLEHKAVLIDSHPVGNQYEMRGNFKVSKARRVLLKQLSPYCVEHVCHLGWSRPPATKIEGFQRVHGARVEIKSDGGFASEKHDCNMQTIPLLKIVMISAIAKLNALIMMC